VLCLQLLRRTEGNYKEPFAGKIITRGLLRERGNIMKRVLALAGMAAIGFAGAAYAGDAKPTVTAPTAMSDSDLDKVTAGTPAGFATSYGVGTARDAPGHANPSYPSPTQPGVDPGNGRCTTRASTGGVC
jgi:hypothetical protein